MLSHETTLSSASFQRSQLNDNCLTFDLFLNTDQPKTVFYVTIVIPATNDEESVSVKMYEERIEKNMPSDSKWKKISVNTMHVYNFLPTYSELINVVFVMVIPDETYGLFGAIDNIALLPGKCPPLTNGNEYRPQLE